MNFVLNFPFFCIALGMVTGVICSILSPKNAKRLHLTVVMAITVMSAFVLYYCVKTGDSYVYMMGHYPAPWGNEIRFGILESGMALFFCIIMLLSVIGGMKHTFEDMEEQKGNLYFTMCNLLLSSLLALVYTNDLFTAYVFVEINTIAAAGLIMMKNNGRTIVAATKYMIMSLLGSGLFLIGITLLYDLTGHLLMSNIKEQVALIASSGEYVIPLTVIIVFISVGLAMKSALYPFHSWLPDAYGFSTATSSALLSSLASKGYIFLLIKIFYRVIGMDVIVENKITNILFIFGIIGMIMGSVSAIKQTDVRRMIAFSSVAQIGYIYMGIGLGTTAGIIASVFHIVSHASSKSMLFIAASGLSEVSGNKKDFKDLRGAAHRNRLAGLAFAVGSFSMVGIPLFAGFISKIYFSTAAVGVGHSKMVITLIVLAISTILNAIYFIRATITMYRPSQDDRYDDPKYRPALCMVIALPLFIILNFALGMCSQPILDAITAGLKMFA